MAFPAIIAALGKLVGGAAVAKGGAATKGFIGTAAKHASKNWMASPTAELGKAPVAKAASPAANKTIEAGGKKEKGLQQLKGIMDKMFKSNASKSSGPGGVDPVSLTPVSQPSSHSGGTSNAVDRPYVPLSDLF